MSLDLLESVSRAGNAPELKAPLSESYLCSAITFLFPEKPVEYWDLNYYNPKTGDITHIRASLDALELKSTDKPLKQSAPKKIDLETVRIGIDDAIKAANAAREKENKSAIQKMFVSLYSEETAVWGINFILANMQIFQVRISAIDGRLIDSKLINFMQNRGIAK